MRICVECKEQKNDDDFYGGKTHHLACKKCYTKNRRRLAAQYFMRSTKNGKQIKKIMTEEILSTRHLVDVPGTTTRYCMNCNELKNRKELKLHEVVCIECKKDKDAYALKSKRKPNKKNINTENKLSLESNSEYHKHIELNELETMVMNYVNTLIDGNLKHIAFTLTCFLNQTDSTSDRLKIKTKVEDAIKQWLENL